MNHPDGLDVPKEEYLLSKAFPIIGQVSVEYSNIEMLLREICFCIGEFEVSHRSYDGNSPFAIALGWMEMRALVNTARALAFRNFTERDFDRFNTLLKCLWEDLRPLRNRIIHDQWVATTDGQIFQSSEGARITKPQSREKNLEFRKSTEHGKEFSEFQKELDKFIGCRDEFRLIRAELKEILQGASSPVDTDKK